MRYSNKKTRLEKREENKRIAEHRLQGKGKYIFRNNTSGDLQLPKKSLDGKVSVGIKDTWLGDDYFMYMLRNNEARLVETIEHPVAEQVVETTEVIDEENQKEEIMNEQAEKLILDQPDQVTDQGTVEHVLGDDEQSLNENEPSETTKNKEVLLTEDPLEGIEILTD